MSYVVFNKATWRVLEKADRTKAYFPQERAAKAFRTRQLNAAKNTEFEKWVAEDIVVDTVANYNANEPMVETYNCLDPEQKPIKIRASLKGTCCDPATETYHSM